MVCAVTGARAADWGFSKGAAAGIIIGAVIFGLLAGVATGFAVIRCYTIYATINSGGPTSLSVLPSTYSISKA